MSGLRVPRVLAFVVIAGAGAAAGQLACNGSGGKKVVDASTLDAGSDAGECPVFCIPDGTLDGGTCPSCADSNGTCPDGCMPEG